jgi:hypothetical protein
MSTTRCLAASALAVVFAVSTGSVAADPITIDYAGYWLENIGSNPLGIAGGGSPTGRLTTLFVAETTPGSAEGTTASANFAGVATYGPFVVDGFWVRRVSDPGPDQLGALTVEFQNGADTASFTGRSLAAVAPIPLVEGLTVDASAEPFGPLVSWALPASTGFDVDHVQLVFYSNETGAEIGRRVTLPPTATAYDIIGPLAPGLDLLINVRLVDLYDDAAPFTTENIQSMSRTYVSYLAPVPEPGSALMLALGLTALSCRRRLARALRHGTAWCGSGIVGVRS